MKLSARDRAVIEQALRQAINYGYDYQSAVACRELLTKMQNFRESDADVADGWVYPAQSDMNDLL